MPEGLEAEIWSRALGVTVGRMVTDAWVDDRVAPPGFGDAIAGRWITGARRAGKVVLIDTTGPTIGLHFGMTGRVIVDGAAPIDKLAYASGLDRSDWDRLRIFTSAPGDGPSRTKVPSMQVPAVRMNDPRRLGRISLDPTLDKLGIDIFSISRTEIDDPLRNSRRAVKTALLDQKLIAGLGNMCADEVLWWAGIAPHRVCRSLETREVDDLVRAIQVQLPSMMLRGGSTEGVLSPDVRAACPPCERDGQGLRRDTIGGRVAVWCPLHQR